MRIDLTALVRIFDDADRKDCLFAPSETITKKTLDGFVRMTAGKFSIDPQASETLSFGDVTAVSGYYIELQATGTDGVVAGATLNVNALGTVPFAPGASSGVTASTLHEGGTGAAITSLELTNTEAVGGINLVGRYAVWGDLTP